MEKLNHLFPNDFTIQAFSLPTIRAAIKLDENDPAAAIEILQPVPPYDLAISGSFDNVYPAYLRGLAYLQLKQGDLAAAEFRKVLDHSGVVRGFVTGALSILQLARAQVLMNDEEAARKSYEDFLALLFTGTHKGEFMAHPVAGKPVRFFAIDILRIRDGKIVEDWHLEDNLTLFEQLGVVSLQK